MFSMMASGRRRFSQKNQSALKGNVFVGAAHGGEIAFKICAGNDHRASAVVGMKRQGGSLT